MNKAQKHINEQLDLVEKDVDKYVFNVTDKPEFLILKTHLLVENYLNDLLIIYNPKNLQLLNKIQKGELGFYNKIELLKKKKKSLFDENEWNLFLSLNRLRNKFAHNLHYTLNSGDIDTIGVWLGDSYFEVKYRKDKTDILLLRYVLWMVISTAYGPIAFYLFNKK